VDDQHACRRNTYQRADCAQAIEQCQRAIGDWPVNASIRFGDASKQTYADGLERATGRHQRSPRFPDGCILADALDHARASSVRSRV